MVRRALGDEDDQAHGSQAMQTMGQGCGQRFGQANFSDTCMACHTSSGDGIERMFPKPAGNAIVNQDDPSTRVRVILTGTQGTATATRPTAPSMPSLGFRLSDARAGNICRLTIDPFCSYFVLRAFRHGGVS